MTRLLMLLILLILSTIFAGKIPGTSWHLTSPSEQFSVLQMTPIDNSIICNPDPAMTNINGTCHSLNFPNLGISGNLQLRFGEANYLDFQERPDNRNRPEPREVSNAACSQPPNSPSNLKQTSRLLIFMGQFVDHDFSLSLENERERDDIEVPPNDAIFPEDLEFFRSETCFAESPVEIGGIRVSLPVRQFRSENTAWLDLGNTYGDTDERNAVLRLFEDGLLNVSMVGNREFPPLDESGRSLCGDIRCEENVQLFAFQTLFLREHNRIARALKAQTGIEDDDILFRQARLRNILQYQSIVWESYLPFLLGRRTFKELTGEYQGHQPGVDPSLSVLFATAAYRYGHSGVSDDLLFVDTGGRQVSPRLSLSDAFLSPEPVRSDDARVLPAIFVGQASVAHDVLEQRVVDGLRNFLFGTGNPSPTQQNDLISRNIARGRDHGLQSFNFYADRLGAEMITCPEDDQLLCFMKLTGEEVDSRILFELYGEFDRCDIWICGMAQRSFEDSLLGELFTVVIAEQFNRIRKGDRIWFENILGRMDLEEEFTNRTLHRFPVRLNDIVRTNLQTDLSGLGAFTRDFGLLDVYIAELDESVFQIEWELPESVRIAEIRQFEVGVEGGGMGAMFQVPSQEQFIKVDDELLRSRGIDGSIGPGSAYAVTVDAISSSGTRTRIGDVTVGTLGVNQSPGRFDGRTSSGSGGGLGGGEIAGIVIGTIAFVAIAGGVGVWAYKKSDFKFFEDPLEESFF